MSKIGLIENKVLKYNDYNYAANKNNFGHYVNDKYETVHNQLYEDALSKMIDDKGYDRTSYNFIEIKQNKYWEPSYVYVRNINPPFDTEKIYLKPYWTNYEYAETHKEINDEFYHDDFNVNALEVIYIDYVNSKVKLKNKDTGEIIEKDFNYLDENTKYNEEAVSLKDTFGYKIQNKIYGK